ncbi:MAG: enoyl-CoA hydratase [Streptosporangiales bacterium]|nr:enoyl-CoA hydratase [Streptosporangiales bacterium]
MERRTWTSKDSALYALAVGASGLDNATELAYSTEDLGADGQRVLPSFAAVVGRRTADAWDGLGDLDKRGLVHGEQALRLYAPLPAAGTVDVQSKVLEVLDKRTGTLIRTRTTGFGRGGKALFEADSGTFLRGVTGIGDAQGAASEPWSLPERDPDVNMRQHTHPEQALLYRLTGDMNPLHADPEVARRAGFPGPILHGLCTYGFACRAVVAQLESGGGKLNGMSARFSAPVYPGDALITRIWLDGNDVTFVVDDDDGRRVLDRGRAW